MDKTDALAGLAVGLVVGALAGLLLAPQSGKKTRKEIEDVAERAAAKALGLLP